MDILNTVVTELNRRKGEWTSLAKIIGVHRKTIERMADRKHDPRYSHVYRLFELLKHR